MLGWLRDRRRAAVDFRDNEDIAEGVGASEVSLPYEREEFEERVEEREWELEMAYKKRHPTEQEAIW